MVGWLSQFFNLPLTETISYKPKTSGSNSVGHVKVRAVHSLTNLPNLPNIWSVFNANVWKNIYDEIFTFEKSNHNL